MILLLEATTQAGLGSFLINSVIMALVLMGGAYLLSGIEVESFGKAFIAAIILAVLNSTIGRFLDFVTTPLRWITLGLFSWVVDAMVLMMAAWFIKGFTIKSFSWALLLAIFVAIANLLLHW
ncbi:MAG: phage holin family protein [Bacteroidetes bacterium]|nr:MAG: phage holin family protein [Bacteroidota bacterium]